VRLYLLLASALLAGRAPAQGSASSVNFTKQPPPPPELQVEGMQPARHRVDVPLDATIRVQMDRPILFPSLTFVRVFGSFSGPISGSFSPEAGESAFRFTPDEDFHPGETITVTIPRRVRGQDGSPMRQAGYGFKFTALAGPAPLEYVARDEVSLRTTPGGNVRLYGVLAADLDQDRRVDLAGVCEVSSDVRVMLNIPEGDLSFQPFLRPTNATGAQPSPSAAADFDDDGLVDMVTANTGANTITYFRGRGDGTFSRGTDVWVGNGPYGVAAVDLNGDGHTDIAASARASGHIAVLLNDGTGEFGDALTFEGGGNREFGLEAQDMNNDGIFDLVFGLWTPPAVSVFLGNGDGTFTQSARAPSGSDIWQVACGDLNGDGHMDVTTANATGNAGVLFGDGEGGLVLQDMFDAGSFSTGTEVGDLDGDGDLDWIVSDFGSHKWSLLENDGAGNFSLVRTFQAVANPSGTSILDIDGDGDLDLALIDEVADLMRLEFNHVPATRFCFGDGRGATPCPCGNDSPVGAQRGCRNSTGDGGLALASGSNSVSAADLELRGSQLPPNQAGFVVASTSDINIPLGDGVLCLGNPQVRLPLRFSDDEGNMTQDDLGSLLPIGAGDRYWFQFFFRDTGGPCGSGFNLTNGVAVSFTQ